MAAFSAGSRCCATTVVEVGVDVPNANIMVIEHAERFAWPMQRCAAGWRHARELLHVAAQGAAGRDRAARLEMMEATEDGFKIAEKDLELRGGEVLGARQRAPRIPHRRRAQLRGAASRRPRRRPPGPLPEPCSPHPAARPSGSCSTFECDGLSACPAPRSVIPNVIPAQEHRFWRSRHAAPSPSASSGAFS
jgi:hypothetical protein